MVKDKKFEIYTDEFRRVKKIIAGKDSEFTKMNLKRQEDAEEGKG
jgi:hypothetical protein